MCSISFRRLHGFSLVELMLTMSIGVVVAGIGMKFLIEGTRASLNASASMSNDMAQWSISSRLQLDSKLANGAAIYSSFNDADLTMEARRDAGQRGNLLILSSSIPEQADKDARYTKISGYLFNPVGSSLSRFEFEVPDDEQTSSLEAIVKAHKTDFELKKVAGDIQSLDSGGPFVGRDTGNANAATATFRLNQGSAAVGTKKSIVIEISFLIRG